jgi:hypothetical protein
MDSPIFSALQEWAHLESEHHKASGVNAATIGAALLAKTKEILRMRARTKQGALIQLRFCATLLEREGGPVPAMAAHAPVSMTVRITEDRGLVVPVTGSTPLRR